MIRFNGIKAQVIVRNKLTSQPQKGVNRLKTFIKNQGGYNIAVRQDYSTNKVNLELLTRSYLPETTSYDVLQTRQVPITSSAKKYVKVVQDMIQAERVASTPAPARKSLLTRIMELAGL